VANQAGEEQAPVTIIDTSTNTVKGTVGPTSGPCGIAITPDGTRAYVSDSGGSGVRIIDTSTNMLLTPNIGVGLGPCEIAVTPDGTHVYVATGSNNTVAVIDTITNTVTNTISASDPNPIAVRADGKFVYVGGNSGKNVQVIDTSTNTVDGLPIPLNTTPEGIALVPAQAPVASFTASVSKKSNVASFDATASTDPGGTIAVYDWDFGDGQTAPNGGPTPSHAYTQPGTYTVTLTLTDSLGCSTQFVYTGQTVSCNGSDVATTTRQVTITSSGPVCPGATPDTQLAELLDMVTGIGPGQSLANKVRQAQRGLAAGDPTRARSMVRAFLNEVRAQSGKYVAADRATELVAKAEQITEALGC
jgi:YVTN family beta-propeller protein